MKSTHLQAFNSFCNEIYYLVKTDRIQANDKIVVEKIGIVGPISRHFFKETSLGFLPAYNGEDDRIFAGC